MSSPASRQSTDPIVDRRDFLRLAAAGGAALAWPAGARAGAPTAMSPADFRTVVSDLERPEGVACAPDGRVFLSTAGAAYAVLGIDGTLTRVGPDLHANGLALDRQGRVVLAVFGLLGGGPGPLLRHDPSTGQIETLASEVGGRTLVASNFPVIARDGTIYCTHSKWADPTNIGNTLADGFVYRVTPAGAVTMETGGLRGANGACLDAEERWLYVAETGSGRIKRLPRSRDGALGPAEDFGPVLGEVVPDHDIADIRRMDAAARGRLGYPDGLAFDAEGNLWVTLPFANKLIAIAPEGRVVEVVHDPEGRVINGPTNLAWGGADLRELYVVSRAGRSLSQSRTGVAGLRLAHRRGEARQSTRSL